MTCIVGLIDNGTVWIGGDSAGVSGLDLSTRADSKVFRNGEFLFGFTSSFRMGQILRYSFTPSAIPDWDLERYMIGTFVNEVRSVFKTYGFAETYNGGEQGGTFLVGVRGRLFTIESDYQVGWNHQPYASVGCGSVYALGSLFTTHTDLPTMDPEKKLIRALETANTFSAGVAPPWTICKI